MFNNKSESIYCTKSTHYIVIICLSNLHIYFVRLIQLSHLSKNLGELKLKIKLEKLILSVMDVSCKYAEIVILKNTRTHCKHFDTNL